MDGDDLEINFFLFVIIVAVQSGSAGAFLEGFGGLPGSPVADDLGHGLGRFTVFVGEFRLSDFFQYQIDFQWEFSFLRK